MATYYRLTQSSAKDPIYHLFDAINFAQHEREKEIRSATKIQSIIKMKQQRSTFFKIVRAVITVQRVYRGYQARKDTLRSIISRDEHRQLKIFHYFATQIQSRFRGYISRKKGFDYYRQRRYIEGVVAKSEAVRKEASEALERQLEEMAEKKDVDRRVAFEKSLANKHHLLSTATISGIYRHPLTVDGLATVFGTNVEDELRIHHQQQSMQQKQTTRKFKKDLPTRNGGAPPSVEEGGEDKDRSQEAEGGGAGASSSVAAAAAVSEPAERGGGGGASSATNSPLKASPPRNPKASSASAAFGPNAHRGGGGGGGMFSTATRGFNQSALPVSSVWGKGAMASQPTQSLQSSTPYDMVEEQERHDQAIAKAVQAKIHKNKAFGVKHKEEPAVGVSVNCQTPYTDPKGLRR